MSTHSKYALGGYHQYDYLDEDFVYDFPRPQAGAEAEDLSTEDLIDVRKYALETAMEFFEDGDPDEVYALLYVSREIERYILEG